MYFTNGIHVSHLALTTTLWQEGQIIIIFLVKSEETEA